MAVCNTHSINYKLPKMCGIHNTHTHTPLCAINFISCRVPHCCGICTLHQAQITSVFNQHIIPGILLPCCELDALCQAHHHNAVKSMPCARHTTTTLWNWRSLLGKKPQWSKHRWVAYSSYQTNYNIAVYNTLITRHITIPLCVFIFLTKHKITLYNMAPRCSLRSIPSTLPQSSVFYTSKQNTTKPV